MIVFRPLVIGPPRSGFALLCSVLAHLQPFGRPKADLRQALVDLFVAQLGDHVSEAVVAAVAARGLEADLVYNGNFRRLTGGPRWAGVDRPGRVCYRKSIGLRGRGDISLVVSHPLAVLHSDTVCHSHSDPAWWPSQPDFAAYTRHASIRHPAAMVVSACLSLNALASEYIQRFLPDGTDVTAIRRELALHKLSDRHFFEAVVRFYVGYLREFLPVRERYAVMRWEDLIRTPEATIRAVSTAARIPIPDRLAAHVWRQLDSRNLTGEHRHNFRPGAAEVGEWRHWLTDRHIAWMRELGLETASEALGYGGFDPIDPESHTPFQRELGKLLQEGRVHRPAVDGDLVGFAFNKSNIDASAFGFRSEDWRGEIRIERSTLSDQAVEAAIADAAGAAAARLNRLLEDLAGATLATRRDAEALLQDLRRRYASSLRPHLPKRYDAAFEAAAALIAESLESAGGIRPPDRRPPLLVDSRGGYNFVAYRGRVFRLPQALGPIDLERDDPTGRPGVAVFDGPRALESLLADGAETMLR